MTASRLVDQRRIEPLALGQLPSEALVLEALHLGELGRRLDPRLLLLREALAQLPLFGLPELVEEFWIFPQGFGGLEALSPVGVLFVEFVEFFLVVLWGECETKGDRISQP